MMMRCGHLREPLQVWWEVCKTWCVIGRGATAVMGFPLLDRLRAAGRQRGVCLS